MAARRRPATRIALALAASLAVHAAVLLTVLAERQPMRGQAGGSALPPVFIELQRSRAAPAPAHQAAPQASGRRPIDNGETVPSSPIPSDAAPAAGAPTSPGAASGPIASADGGGSPGPAPGPALK